MDEVAPPPPGAAASEKRKADQSPWQKFGFFNGSKRTKPPAAPSPAAISPAGPSPAAISPAGPSPPVAVVAGPIEGEGSDAAAASAASSSKKQPVKAATLAIWKREFPWLSVLSKPRTSDTGTSEQQRVQCSICVEAKAEGLYASEQGAAPSSSNDLKQHGLSKTHLAARKATTMAAGQPTVGAVF